MHVIRHLPQFLKRPLVKLTYELVRAKRLPSRENRDLRSSFTKGPLIVSGLLNEVLGIGQSASMAIGAFELAGFSPVKHEIRPVLQGYPRNVSTLEFPRGGVWLIVANPPECEILLQSYKLESWVDRYRIGYWAWETTEAPSNWTRTASWFHEIWAPSQFSADAIKLTFRKAGRSDLETKVRVFPYPAPRVDFTPDRSRFGLPREAFVGLMSFDGRSGFTRKNPIGVLRSWMLAFPEESKGAVLVIKTLPTAHLQAEWTIVQELIKGRRDVVLISESLDRSTMISLISSCDVLISLARAEGFGLPLAEAMALGRCVVTTAYSAPMEFLDKSTAMLVPARPLRARDSNGIYHRGWWSDPDVIAAANAIRELSVDSSLREKLGENAKKSIGRLNVAWSLQSLSETYWRDFVGFE